MAGVPKRVIDHFQAVPLFARVSKRGLRLIASEADEFEVPTGKDLVREGELGRHLYVILSGKARVHRGGRRIATLGPGAFFGEMALLSNVPRMATVTSETAMTVMTLSSRDLPPILDKEPSVAQSIMAVMADRICQNERMAAL
jgi:CRP/FNR family transcriptional regulator, cyclic AMP receptor protein